MKSKQMEWQHWQQQNIHNVISVTLLAFESISICSQQQSNGWFSQNWFYAFVFGNRSTDSIFWMMCTISLFTLFVAFLPRNSAHFAFQLTIILDTSCDAYFMWLNVWKVNGFKCLFMWFSMITFMLKMFTLDSDFISMLVSFRWKT